MRQFSIAPKELAASLWRNRSLIRTLSKREILGRYQGSVLGVLWSVFNPIFMLVVYTFVFSVIFQARWGEGGATKVEFALILFAGLLVFNLFAECVTRAPGIIIGNASYVKRVIFPLETLPWVTFGAALFHAGISLLVWFIFYVTAVGPPKITILLFPIVLIPLVLQIMGISWFLASLGVYLRDVSQVVGIIVSTLMFLTPIFYPVAALPVAYRSFIYINPLSYLVELTRDLLLVGKGPDWGIWMAVTAASGVISWLGFVWFQKTRKGFADVL